MGPIERIVMFFANLAVKDFERDLEPEIEQLMKFTRAEEMFKLSQVEKEFFVFLVRYHIALDRSGRLLPNDNSKVTLDRSAINNREKAKNLILGTPDEDYPTLAKMNFLNRAANLYGTSYNTSVIDENPNPLMQSMKRLEEEFKKLEANQNQ